MTSESVRVRAIARGRVQMVGYRAFVLRHAGEAGLRGTVRNQPDGTVEVLLQGSRDAVEGMVQRLREGPRGARVDRLDVDELTAEGELPPITVTA